MDPKALANKWNRMVDDIIAEVYEVPDSGRGINWVEMEQACPEMFKIHGPSGPEQRLALMKHLTDVIPRVAGFREMIF